MRWGRTVTHRPGIKCVTAGIPEVAQRPGQAVEMLQPSGTLNPGDRYVGDRYQVSLDQTPPAPREDGGSPWSGLSGAALFCGDLLVGVVASDPAGWGLVGKPDTKVTEAEFKDEDFDPCVDFPDSEMALWRGEENKSGYVLCLGPVE